MKKTTATPVKKRSFKKKSAPTSKRSAPAKKSSTKEPSETPYRMTRFFTFLCTSGENNQTMQMCADSRAELLNNLSLQYFTAIENLALDTGTVLPYGSAGRIQEYRFFKIISEVPIRVCDAPNQGNCLIIDHRPAIACKEAPKENLRPLKLYVGWVVFRRQGSNRIERLWAYTWAPFTELADENILNRVHGTVGNSKSQVLNHCSYEVKENNYGTHQLSVLPVWPKPKWAKEPGDPSVQALDSEGKSVSIRTGNLDKRVAILETKSKSQEVSIQGIFDLLRNN